MSHSPTAPNRDDEAPAAAPGMNESHRDRAAGRALFYGDTAALPAGCPK